MSVPETPGPRLEVMSNGRVERLVPIREAGVVIGRAPGLEVRFDDARVSREHARVELRDDGTCYLVDTSTYRATFLNGRRLADPRPVLLCSGDTIRVADHELVFRGAATVVPDDGDDSSSVLHSLTDLTPATLALSSVRPADAFRAVLDVSRALGGGGGLDEILGRALDSLMAVFPLAERGLIVTAEPDGRLPIRAARTRGGPPPKPTLSRSILDRVLTRGEAVLIQDVKADGRFRDRESVRLQFRTALCVPLTGHDGRPVGMAQLGGPGGKAGAFTGDDLDLLAALACPLAVAVENHRLLLERADRDAAREIQRALLPHDRPELPGYTFWECYSPALEVGGDLYDYIRVDREGRGDDPRWVVAVGDVSGKGVRASLVSVAVCPEVRHAVWSGAPPHEVLARVNRQVCEGGFDGLFVTLILAELDPRTHALTLASAGHELPLIRRAGGAVERIEVPGSGQPLGVTPGETYRPVTVPMRPGEVVVLHTDGLTDASDREGRRFGAGRVRATLSGAPPGVVPASEALLAAVGEHARDRSPFDDLTVVSFGRDAL